MVLAEKSQKCSSTKAGSCIASVIIRAANEARYRVG